MSTTSNKSKRFSWPLPVALVMAVGVAAGSFLSPRSAPLRSPRDPVAIRLIAELKGATVDDIKNLMLRNGLVDEVAYRKLEKEPEYNDLLSLMHRVTNSSEAVPLPDIEATLRNFSKKFDTSDNGLADYVDALIEDLQRKSALPGPSMSRP